MTIYLIWFFIALFFGLLPLSSVLEYRKTGIERYKTMSIISTAPTIMCCFYASLMAEAPALYYYLAIMIFALLLLLAVFVGLPEEEEED